MKPRIVSTLSVVSFLMFSQSIQAGSGALFEVSASDPEGTISFDLCLNGVGPFSCQTYTVDKLTLSIFPTIPNHFYPIMGIKINTPGYIPTGCTLLDNGYCVFSGSSTNPVTIPVISDVVIPPLLAVGTYDNSTGGAPLAAQSADNGLTWTYTLDSASTSFPLLLEFGILNSAHCTGNHCVAGGSYYNGTNTLPLVMTSADGGVNWVTTLDGVTPALPGGFTSGRVSGVDCEASYCVAAGIYAGANDRPIIATSTLSGSVWSDWTYTLDDTTPAFPDPQSTTFRRLVSASCSGMNCIAPGSYYNNTDSLSYPLIAHSGNGGLDWNYTVYKGVPSALPDSGTSGLFNSASCDGDNCIAVGTMTAAGAQPLLASSTNGGATWAYQFGKTSPTLPGTGSSGLFFGASCSGENCIALGRYTDTNVYPLVARREGLAGSWEYVVDSANLPTPSTSGSLWGGGCDGQVCVAGGAYSNGGNDFPYLIVSTNGGVDWTVKVDQTIPTPVGNFNMDSGRFSSAGCQGSVCLASGSYVIGSDEYPLQVVSTDGGVTWSYVIDATTPTLPSDYSRLAAFNNSNLSNSLSQYE